MKKIKFILVFLIFFGFTQLKAQLIIHSFALNAGAGFMMGTLADYNDKSFSPGYLFNMGASYTINKTFCLRLNYQRNILFSTQNKVTYSISPGINYSLDFPKLPNATVGSFRFDMLMGWFGSTSHVLPYFLLGGGYNSVNYDAYQTVQNDSSNYTLVNNLTSNNWYNIDLGFGLIYRIPPRIGIYTEIQLNGFAINKSVGKTGPGVIIPLMLGLIYSF